MSSIHHCPTTSDQFNCLLEAQYKCIWDQEVQLFTRYFTTSSHIKILDVGCGMGGATQRLSSLFPNSTIVGVDLKEYNIHINTEQYKHLNNVQFQQANAYELEQFQDATFDLVINRHVLQEVEFPEKILKQMFRVCKKGGYLHILGEDYGMFSSSPDAKIAQDLSEMMVNFYQVNGDGLIGRKLYKMLCEKFTADRNNIDMNYIVVDSSRGGDDMSDMLISWMNIIKDALSEISGIPVEKVIEIFERMCDCARNEYACWQIPIFSIRND